MAYLGLLPSESSSGKRISRGAISKMGNTRVRRLLVEAALKYRCAPNCASVTLKRRWKDLPEEIVEHAWKAQLRFNRRYHRMRSKGKPVNVITIAIARELVGFIWAIATQIERESNQKSQVA